MTTVIGIDPGVTGAVAVLGECDAVYDMPALNYSKTGFVKRALDARRLAGFFDTSNAVVFIERVSAFPEQGVASMFSLGMSYWGAYSVCAALGFDIHLVEPRAWKTYFGLSKDKDASLTLARKLYPHADLALAKHHNRAEALLIARYGLLKGLL